MISQISAATLVLAAFIPAAFAEGLLPVGDSFFALGNNSNFGVSPTINVGGAGAYRGLVQFDLTTLPPGVTAAGVARANLLLFVNKVGAAGAVDINAASGPWTEGAVNGPNAPAIGMPVATAVPVNTAGVYVVVDATAVVKAWLNNSPANQGLILYANAGFPATSVFFDSKESVSTSHPAILEVSLAGGGATGPAGPQGPIGLTGATGPQGPAGPAGSGVAGLFQSTLFESMLVSPIGAVPDQLATLSFIPPVTGTAVLFGRGFCNLASLASGNNTINVIAGPAAAAAPFSRPVGEWGLANVAGGSVGTFPVNFTSQSAIPVVANTPYSMTLFARHGVGVTTSNCTGSFAVQVF